jgi:hypothetical protein
MGAILPHTGSDWPAIQLTRSSAAQESPAPVGARRLAACGIRAVARGSWSDGGSIRRSAACDTRPIRCSGRRGSTWMKGALYEGRTQGYPAAGGRTMNCANCGEPFTIDRPARGPRKRFCSAECRQEAANRRAYQREKALAQIARATPGWQSLRDHARRGRPKPSNNNI